MGKDLGQIRINIVRNSLCIFNAIYLFNLALKSVKGLISKVSSVTRDPYILSLQEASEEVAEDKDKVSLALLLATQLCGYLEGQTGLVNLGGGGPKLVERHFGGASVTERYHNRNFRGYR